MTTICLALEELIRQEEGIRFQRLAVALAKKRYPQLIATEVHRDGGEDALTTPSFVADGRRVSVCCSLTATLAKIKGDIKRIHERGQAPDRIVFYTPDKITNVKSADNWAKAVADEFNCGLLVISREDIIQELIRPDNSWMCREFLKLDVPHPPDIEGISKRAADASGGVLDQWKSLILSDYAELITLDMIGEDSEDPSQKLYNYHDVAKELIVGGRIALLGSPGAGKTTTLIQLCDELLQSNKVPLLVSLREWVDSGEDIATFITRIPTFTKAEISRSDFIQLHENGFLIFVLNGWNEIHQEKLIEASNQLTRLGREFPASGIIIATRDHSMTPPLCSMKLRLKPVSPRQRNEYIVAVLSDASNSLIEKIQASSALTQMSRTPLILAELIQSYNSEIELPETRAGIIELIIRRMEASSDHSPSLQAAPISGRQEGYLINLAMQMTSEGSTRVSEAQALGCINEYSEVLQTIGNIASLPEPTTILDILCSHHILVRLCYPETAFFFMHQQLQEFYAFLGLEQTFSNTCESGVQEEIRGFQESFIDVPAWDEPIRMLAEAIGSEILASPTDVDRNKWIQQGKCLFEWTVFVDPFFSSTLARILGTRVWQVIRDVCESILNKWYECSCNEHRQCAVAAMINTGTDAFSGLIWSLLEDPDQQVRLDTYQANRVFYLSSLGEGWRDKILSWEADRRSEFISELAHVGEYGGINIVEYFAKCDPDPSVRAKAIKEISWFGNSDTLSRLLEECDDETFRIVIQDGYVLEQIQNDLAERAKKEYKSTLWGITEQAGRLRVLLKMWEIDPGSSCPLMKAELEKCDGGGQDVSEELLHLCAKKVLSLDAGWISQWVVQRQAEGKLRYDHWSEFVRDVPPNTIDSVLDRLFDLDCAEDYARRVIGLVSTVANEEQVDRLLGGMIDLQRDFDSKADFPAEPERKLSYRLRDILKDTDWSKIVHVILEHHPCPKGTSELAVVLSITGCLAFQGRNSIAGLDNEILSEFRKVLEAYHAIVLEESDYSGTLKADMSCALATFGEPSHAKLIIELIQKDIIRVREGREAFKKGERNTERINGCSRCWSRWHLDALSYLISQDSEQALFDLMEEPEYEEDAAKHLVQLLKRDVPADESGFGIHKPLKLGHDSWMFGHINGEKRKAYSDFLVSRIQTIKEEADKTDSPQQAIHRMKNFTRILAQFGDVDTAPLILNVMALPQEWDNWIRVETLEVMIQNGVNIKTSEAERVLGPVIENLIKSGCSQQSDRYLLARSLQVLCCTDSIIKALEIVRDVMSRFPLHYDLRGIIESIGHADSSGAAAFLLELYMDKSHGPSLAREIIQSLSGMENELVDTAMLEFIDYSCEKRMQIYKDSGTVIARALAQRCTTNSSIKERVFELCQAEVPHDIREVLGEVVCSISSPESVVAGLGLISDTKKPQIPYWIKQAIENALLVKIPSKDYEGAYELEPCSDNMIRSKLFEIVINDAARHQAAFQLLGYIEILRIEHGKPVLEGRHPNITSKMPWPPFDVIGCQHEDNERKT